MANLFVFLISFFLTTAFLSVSQAEFNESLPQQKLSLYYDQEVVRPHFALGFEAVSISSGKASILGAGPRTGFEYGITQSLSLGTNIVFAFQATGKPGAYFYSGISGIIRYSFTGSSIKVTDKIYQMGRAPIYSGRIVAQRRLCLNGGLEQLFLNGSASIYPAVGATAGLTWGGILFGYEVEVDARMSKLVANDNPLSMMAIGANINLDFM